MVLKKTCWYTTIYPSRVGALIGTRGDASTSDRFIRFGFFLGAAFQIQDDLLNLVRRRTRYGKELDGDIWEGKRTLHADPPAARGTPDERERLSASLGTLAPDERDADGRLGARADGRLRLHRLRAPGRARARGRRAARVRAGLRGPARLARQALHRGAATWVIERN